MALDEVSVAIPGDAVAGNKVLYLPNRNSILDRLQ